MAPNWASGTLNQLVSSSVPAGGRIGSPDGLGLASGATS